MAQLLKQKFLAGIDSTKFHIAQNGALMVKNSQGQMVELLKLDAQDQALLLGVKIANESDLNDVIADLTQEISDRQAAVSAEQSRAEGEESRIEGKVDSEKSRAEGEEARIEGKVDTEKSRAEAAEAALDGRVDSLESDMPTKAATTYVDSQDAATLADSKAYADQKISDLINGAPAMLDTLKEIADQLANDESVASALANTVSGIASDLSAEVSRAQGAESTLQSDLNTEISRAQSEESRIEGKVNTEQSRAEGEEARIEGKVDTEKSRAEGEEARIEGKVDTEKSRAESEEARIEGKVDTEKSRAEGEEARIEGKVDTEKSRAESAESALDGRLDVLESVTWKAVYVESLSSSQISNQYIDLADKIVDGSLFISSDRVVLYEGIDFSVSTVNNKTRVTLMGDVAIGGSSELDVNDDMYFKYQYKA